MCHSLVFLNGKYPSLWCWAKCIAFSGCKLLSRNGGTQVTAAPYHLKVYGRASETHDHRSIFSYCLVGSSISEGKGCVYGEQSDSDLDGKEESCDHGCPTVRKGHWFTRPWKPQLVFHRNPVKDPKALGGLYIDKDRGMGGRDDVSWIVNMLTNLASKHPKIFRGKSTDATSQPLSASNWRSTADFTVPLTWVCTWLCLGSTHGMSLVYSSSCGVT